MGHLTYGCLVDTYFDRRGASFVPAFSPQRLSLTGPDTSGPVPHEGSSGRAEADPRVRSAGNIRLPATSVLRGAGGIIKLRLHYFRKSLHARDVAAPVGARGLAGAGNRSFAYVTYE